MNSLSNAYLLLPELHERAEMRRSLVTKPGRYEVVSFTWYYTYIRLRRISALPRDWEKIRHATKPGRSRVRWCRILYSSSFSKFENEQACNKTWRIRGHMIRISLFNRISVLFHELREKVRHATKLGEFDVMWHGILYLVAYIIIFISETKKELACNITY